MSYGGGYGGGGYGGYGGGQGGGNGQQYAQWSAQAQLYSGGGGGGYGGGAGAGGYGGAAAGAGGYGGAPGGYGGAPGGYGGAPGGYGGGAGGYGAGAGGGGAPGGAGRGGGDLQSRLQSLSSGGFSAGGGFSGSRGGLGSGGRGGGGGYDMKKFAAYQTNKRKFDDRGGRGGGPGEKRDRPDRPRREKPREGREPELNIFIDKRFNVWNLPVKAKVLLASNLPQVVCQPDLLYNIFSFYGDIERIKLIRRAQSCALIEFTTATFACLARDHLDQVTLAGEKLVCTFSRYDRVKMPHEAGLPADGDTKDFSGHEYDKFKRYRTEDLKRNNMKKIIHPTSTIHIGGIQAGKSPNDVKRLFESRGLVVTDCIGVAIKAKKPKENEPPGTSSGPKMFCYVQFQSVDDALVGIANYGNSVGMRMSFAKDNLETQKKNLIEKKMALILGDQRG